MQAWLGHAVAGRETSQWSGGGKPCLGRRPHCGANATPSHATSRRPITAACGRAWTSSSFSSSGPRSSWATAWGSPREIVFFFEQPTQKIRLSVKKTHIHLSIAGIIKIFFWWEGIQGVTEFGNGVTLSQNVGVMYQHIYDAIHQLRIQR